MSRITADGEEVIFDEGKPNSLLDIFELVSLALGEKRKAIVKFDVDGKDCLQTGTFPETFESIDIQSLYHDEIILRISIQLLDQISELVEQLKIYQGNVLSTPWSQVFNQMDQFIKKIQPFADFVDNIAPYMETYSPPWADRFTSIAHSQAKFLNTLLTSFEHRQPAVLTSCLDSDFIPLCESAQLLLSDEIIPYLKRFLQSKKPNLSDDA